MKNEIKTIGIVGEGKMGTNLFYYLLEFGFSIVWLCSENADLEKLQKTYLKKIKRLFDAGVIDNDRNEFLLKNILLTKEINNLIACDLIIEAITENLEHKKNLFSILDPLVLPHCIFTSNSSSINPSEMCPSVMRQDKFAGLHFFYPVSLKNIAELIITDAVSEETQRRLVEFLTAIERDHILLKEDSSFILNRIFLDLQNDAFRIVSAGEFTIYQMDVLIKKHFSPSGVFEFCDNVGNDIMLESVNNYKRNDNDNKTYLPFIRKLEMLVHEKKLGIKTGEGFYVYDNGTQNSNSIREENAAENHQETVKHLHSVIRNSLIKWSDRGKIPLLNLNNAMKEYLGSEKDFF